MRPLLLWLLVLSLFVPLVLLLETAELHRQLLLAASTLAMLVMLGRSLRIPRGAIITSVVIASVGEVVLSVGWELYSYRDALIPLYVPFGHGVFYAIAMASAERLPSGRFRSALVPAVLLLGSVYALLNLVGQRDEWGAVWWVIAATVIARSRDRELLAICCVYTVALELLGTGLGNWQWAATVPGLSLRAANPPSGVGVLYVVLDLLTVSAAGMTVRWRRRFAPVEEAQASRA